MFDKGEIISLDNEKLIIIVTLNKNNHYYAFANKLDNNEITEDYYIIEKNNEKISKVIDENIINEIFPDIQNELKKEINDLGINVG